MVKQYKQRVSSCFGCPNYTRLTDGDIEVLWCRVMSQLLYLTPHKDKIPDWCPLPEVPNQEDTNLT